MRRFAAPITLFILVACATHNGVERVVAYREAHQRGDKIVEQSYLSPDARIWFEKREGDGDPLTAAGGGRWAHWDEYFHSTSTASDWKQSGDAVSAVIHETNDFYRLLDWTPNPYRMTWWLDAKGRITGALVEGLPGKTVSRMDEFKAWAAQHHPDELSYLMPNGRIDPTGDRPERFRAILTEWRTTIR